ncbi:SDR family NAD(P)-dependent oxidoreductase [Streptomyces sp. NRRL F-5135]|uniref:SDR family NAD(P)-dependent oxidoreductase n=1 Tax=Streptomyces sp. NRRL F-5135 TaxID=1463858 RepID=UPI000A6B4584|nr:SDR family NAD(P)-dependent oxidoreductase [Streptomyces sp. NRRL F-5135]
MFFCGRREQLGRHVAAGIRAAGGEATFLRADVRRESEVRDLVRACVSRYGRLDVAGNNAGVESPRAARLHEQSLTDMEDVWRANAGGVFLGMKYEIPQMLAQGGGVIVNTTSISAEVVWVFPSVSRRWPDASVQGLRTQGAFLVDADRSGGRTRWVRVHSRAGAPLVLQHGIDGAIDVRDEHGRRLRHRETAAGRIEVPLGPGETAVVLRRGTHADLGPRDVPAVGDSKPWGLPD